MTNHRLKLVRGQADPAARDRSGDVIRSAMRAWSPDYEDEEAARVRAENAAWDKALGLHPAEIAELRSACRRAKAVRGMSRDQLLAVHGLTPADLDAMERWSAGLERLDALKHDLPDLKPSEIVSRAFRAGVAFGQASERQKIEKMANSRRCRARPEIEALVLEGKTIGQIKRATGASPSTIKRVRAKLKGDGLLS